MRQKNYKVTFELFCFLLVSAAGVGDGDDGLPLGVVHTSFLNMTLGFVMVSMADSELSHMCKPVFFLGCALP